MKCPMDKNTKSKTKKKHNIHYQEVTNSIGSLRNLDNVATTHRIKEGRFFSEKIKEKSEVN